MENCEDKKQKILTFLSLVSRLKPWWTVKKKFWPNKSKVVTKEMDPKLCPRCRMNKTLSLLLRVAWITSMFLLITVTNAKRSL